MHAQRKAYLDLAAKSKDLEDKVFYELMADVSPAFSEALRRHINTIGTRGGYSILVRAITSVVLEVGFNLAGGREMDASLKDAIAADFRQALDDFECGRTVGEVACTPALNS